MAVTLKLSNPLTSVPVDMTKDSQVLFGYAAIAAGNYVAGGIVLAWVPGLLTNAGTTFFPQSSTTVPYDAAFKSNSGSGYEYQWDAATDTLRVFLAGVELTAGAAIPGAVAADVISFRAWFLKA